MPGHSPDGLVVHGQADAGNPLQGILTAPETTAVQILGRRCGDLQGTGERNPQHPQLWGVGCAEPVQQDLLDGPLVSSALV